MSASLLLHRSVHFTLLEQSVILKEAWVGLGCLFFTLKMVESSAESWSSAEASQPEAEFKFSHEAK